MKTILVAIEYPPKVGGVENYYDNLVSNWPEEIVVIDDSEHKLLALGWPVLRWLRALMTIYSTVKNTKADWVIAGEILPIGTAAYLASFFTTFKYAVVLHGLDFSLATNSAWKKFLSRKILQKAKIIICANSKTAELVKIFIGKDKLVAVVNPGINPQRPVTRPGLINGLKSNYGLTNKKILLSIGRLVKRKGVNDVLTVLPEILQTEPNLRYIIIGTGPEEDNIRKILTDPELTGKVFLLTNISDEEKWAWLELCDIFILPTKEIKGDYEGFGIVYLEANLCAKPVIASRSGGVADAVVDGLNGRLLQANDATGLKQAIIELVSDQALCNKLGEQGKTRALNDFTWSKQIEKIYNFLKANI